MLQLVLVPASEGLFCPHKTMRRESIDIVHGVTPQQFAELRKKALEARELSYSPYSKFRVGCCLLTNDGEYVTGANVENASYGGAICAERTTIVKTLTASNQSHSKRGQWRCLAISGDSLESCITPCGICRQFIREFASTSLPIVMFNGDGSKYIVKTLEELLPLSFGPDDLGSH